MNNNVYTNPNVNPYMNTYNQPIGYSQPMNYVSQPLNSDDYIKFLEKEKERVEKSKEQYMNRMQQQPTLNQTIQLAPTNQNVGIKYVNSIEDVKKELTLVETPFITTDFSQMFIKNAKGEIRTFFIEEQIPKDEKDIIIEQLRSENDKLKGMIENEPSDEHDDEECDTTIDKPTKTKTTSNVSNARTSKTKSK